MSYSFTNTTNADQYVVSKSLGMASNYGRITDEPDMARVSNKTASLEQPEIMTFRCVPLTKVDVAVPVRNPGVVRSGVQYSAKLETINRFTNADGSVVDEPIGMWLTIKHPLSDHWDNAAVAVILDRLISSLMKGQTTTGTKAEITQSQWRFEDLMRSALMPTED